MKRIICLLLCAVLLTGTAGCGILSRRALDCDLETETVVKVITKTGFYASHSDDDELKYYAVGTGFRDKSVEPFISDELTTFDVTKYYDSYIDSHLNKVLVRRNDVPLDSAMRAQVEKYPVLSDIMLEIGKLQHNLMLVRILKDGDEYFVYTFLNVNWQSPNNLYYYDKDRRFLVKLDNFDNMEIIGLSIQNLDLIKQ